MKKFIIEFTEVCRYQVEIEVEADTAEQAAELFRENICCGDASLRSGETQLSAEDLEVTLGMPCG